VLLHRGVYQELQTLPVGLHNFVEIVTEKEYSFSKYLLARLLSTAGRGERGSRGFRLV
jgi:hypothetical protein